MFFSCFLILVNIFNSNIQHFKTYIQHHIYTIFEQRKYSCFIFSHMRLQRVILITRKGVIYSICQVKRIFTLVQVIEISFKCTRVVYDDNHSGIGVRCGVYFPWQDTNVNLRYAAYQWKYRSPVLPHGLIKHESYQQARSKAYLQNY